MSRVSFPEPEWQIVEQPPASRQEPLPRWGLAEWFVISQTALPALLYLDVFQSLRVLTRVGAFVISLTALVLVLFHRKRRLPVHPSAPWLIPAVAYLALMVLHPTTNTVLAGIAQVMLYISVMAPVFWAPSIVRSPAHLQRLMWLLLILNGVNSGVGVLQVYDPATWMPRELTLTDSSGVVQNVRTNTYTGSRYLTYRGPQGETIVRPPGLFDSPGAVAAPGMFSGLIGLAFCVMSKGIWKKLVALIFAFLGASVIYLTHVRTSLILMLGMLVLYVAVLVINKRLFRAMLMVGLAGGLVTAAFSLALLLGGPAVRERFASLLAQSPSDVYYSNRGAQLEYSVPTFLSDYPFGAGLGRWGMMRRYFGNPWNLSSPMIWAEIQFPAWILDGGFILLFLYSGALLANLKREGTLSIRGQPESLWTVAALVFVVNAGTVALSFSFTPFTSQIGLQYWLLSGALHGAAYSSTEFETSKIPEPGAF